MERVTSDQKRAHDQALKNIASFGRHRRASRLDPRIVPASSLVVFITSHRMACHPGLG